MKTLWLFHHAPDASDDDLDQLAERWSGGVQGMGVRVAKEDLVVNLEG